MSGSFCPGYGLLGSGLTGGIRQICKERRLNGKDRKKKKGRKERKIRSLRNIGEQDLGEISLEKGKFKMLLRI